MAEIALIFIGAIVLVGVINWLFWATGSRWRFGLFQKDEAMIDEYVDPTGRWR